ncbi:hypothetical protein LIER_32024 [Lithospermum erythrorhizon]|uniref:Uncharacterized protein n=1 Tax=Lithospermum erythrorhizon TaxID=34254 RepID=A0AAV3RYN0_LITER
MVIPKVTYPTIVVEVPSSDTLSDPIGNHQAPSPTPIALPPATAPKEEVCHREGKAPMLVYDGKYLENPFQIPNLEVSLNSPWNSRKFNYHLTRPLFSKQMAAQYKPLRDPYAALAQSMKHVLQAVNGTHILAKRAHHLARMNSALEYQLKCQKNAFSHKNTLLKGLDIERTNLKTELKDVERADLISERNASQTHYKELEQARVGDDLRATEALNQAKKERDAALASLTSSSTLATQNIREFLNSDQYASKIQSECAAYFATLPLDHKDRFPNLITLFNEEKVGKPN